MPNSKNSYRHRHPEVDTATRRAGADELVARLLELERKTSPVAGAETEEDKDFAASQALDLAANLVEWLAGWAIDHQIGLALNGLTPTRSELSVTRDHPDYLSNKSAADDHRHEAEGSAYPKNYDLPKRDIQAERRLLANLLQANPGGFPIFLTTTACEALRALDLGETQHFLRPEKTTLDRNAYTRRRMELLALQHVEYLSRRGMRKMKAQEQVGEAYGRDASTVRKWQVRLRNEMGQLEVSRALNLAHNGALNAEDAKRKAMSDQSARDNLRYFDWWLGEKGLERNAAKYKAAVAQIIND